MSHFFYINNLPITKKFILLNEKFILNDNLLKLLNDNLMLKEPLLKKIKEPQTKYFKIDYAGLFTYNIDSYEEAKKLLNYFNMAKTELLKEYINIVNILKITKKDFLKDLITSDHPYVYLHGGAGTGKSTLLVAQAIYLHRHNKIFLYRMLFLTFSKSGVQALENKLMAECAKHNIKIRTDVFTFHSFCHRILTQNDLSFQTHNILTDADKMPLLEKIMVKNQIFGFKISELVKNLSLYKKYLVSQKIIQSRKTFNFSLDALPFAVTPDFLTIYHSYQTYLKTHYCHDYDDLLILAYQCLTTNPKILAFFQEEYRLLMVDEFQDNNIIQYAIVALICQKQAHKSDPPQ